jgi:hypothetical protein
MKTIREVSKETGYGVSTISRFAKAINVQKVGKGYLFNDLEIQEFLSSRNQSPSRKGKEITVEDVNKSSTKSYTAHKVAAIIGVPYDTIRKYAKAFNIPSGARGIYHFSRKDINELVDRVVQKASLKEAVDKKAYEDKYGKTESKTESKSSQTKDLINGLKHNFKKKHHVDLVDARPKIDLLNLKLQKLEMMADLTKLDIERETLSLEIDKVMG